MAATERVKRLVWVRAAGRCVICNRYLISSHLDDRATVRQIGEVAHIAGESETGPRGTSDVLSADRNVADNLLLLCPNDHTDADSGRLTDPQYTEEFLHATKDAKEAWVEFVTGLGIDRTTTVLRLSGDVRSSTCLIDRHDAAETTMRGALRTPRYLPDPRGVGLTIDVTNVPEPGTTGYWEACLRQIRHELGRLRESVRVGDTTHVSVFAFALIPLLVALGYALDDTVDIDVYNRHRQSDSWHWDPLAPTVDFVSSIPDTDGAKEAVVLVNASGTIQRTELPAAVRGLPCIVVEPHDAHTPSPLTFASLATLDSFTTTFRRLLADLERHKHVGHTHLFLAAPLAAAVNIGRVWPHDNAAPSVTVYHRTVNSYEPAITLPTDEV
jgi:hypothetical protein